MSTLSRHNTLRSSLAFHFFFNDTATTEIYTLSLHDALPISAGADRRDQLERHVALVHAPRDQQRRAERDRKSTRLNSSHGYISYAVFCLKKKSIPRTKQFTAGASTKSFEYKFIFPQGLIHSP